MELEIETLKKENEKLKALVRFMYLTLGYYGTPYNYNPDNNVYHPITGKVASGILHEAGHEARYALKLATKGLGYTSDEITEQWGSVLPSMEAWKEFSKENWVCDTPCCCNDLNSKETKFTPQEKISASVRLVEAELAKLQLIYKQELANKKQETV